MPPPLDRAPPTDARDSTLANLALHVDAKLVAAAGIHETNEHAELIKTGCSFAGSLAASVVGATVYSVGTAQLRSAALSVPLALAASSVTGYGVKSMLEDLTLDERDRDVSKKDLIWGAVDGLAGIAGGLVEKSVSKWYLEGIGRDALGSVSTRTAFEAGKMLVQDSALSAIGLATVRGIGGGAAAAAVWSLPRRIDENANLLKSAPLQTLGTLAKETVVDTAIGAITGGVLAGGCSILSHSPELAARAFSKVRPQGDLTWVDIFSINDLHSSLDQLPKLKTRLDELIEQSHAKGRTAIFVVAGDPISGHVNFAFTRNGEVEYRAIADLGAKADATIIGLGNHEYDAPGGRFDVKRFPGVIAPILQEHPNIHLVNANLDVTAIPGFEPLIKRSVTIPLRTANGIDALGITGVTTEEGAIGGIKYNDSLAAAGKAIDELNSQGIKSIQLTTHIGASEDEELAHGLLKNGYTVAISNGGHSHTPIPTLHWIGNKTSLADRLQFWKPTEWIPNAQAGNAGRWLSVNHIAIRPNGASDRWLSQGFLEPITASIEENAPMRAMLDSEAVEVKTLRETTYGARVTSNYSLKGVRTQETPLGNLMADAIHDGLQKRAGIEAPQIVLANSGGIRSDLYAGHDISRLDLANVVMNAGRVEGERKELTLVRMTGAQLRKGLEFSIKDLPVPESPSVGERLKQLVGATPPPKPFDPSGNFMQVSGMKFTFDSTKPPMERVASMQVKTATGAFAEIMDDQQYKVVTRFHAIDKWHKSGLFGDVPLTALYDQLQSNPVAVSQVDLLADYISGKTLNPLTDSKISGRITNLAKYAADMPIKLGTYVAAPATLSASIHEPEN